MIRLITCRVRNYFENEAKTFEVIDLIYLKNWVLEVSIFPKKRSENPSPLEIQGGGRQNFPGAEPPPLTLSLTAPRAFGPWGQGQNPSPPPRENRWPPLTQTMYLRLVHTNQIKLQLQCTGSAMKILIFKMTCYFFLQQG